MIKVLKIYQFSNNKLMIDIDTMVYFKVKVQQLLLQYIIFVLG